MHQVLALSSNIGQARVFAFGFNDAAYKNSDQPQVELGLSVKAARKIMSQAETISKVLWIGPTPLA